MNISQLADSLNGVAERFLEDFLDTSTGEFWDDIQLNVSVHIDGNMVTARILGKRKKDAGKPTLWQFWSHMKPKDAASISHFRDQVNQLYLTLRQYDSCNCTARGLEHVPCELHGGIEFKP